MAIHRASFAEHILYFANLNIEKIFPHLFVKKIPRFLSDSMSWENSIVTTAKVVTNNGKLVVFLIFLLHQRSA